MRIKKTLILIFFSLAIPVFAGFAQNIPAVPALIDSLLEVTDKEIQQEESILERGVLENNIKKAQEFTFQINRINNIVNNSLDTAELERIIPMAERFMTLAGSRLENQGSKMNLRYLNAMENWLKSTQNQIQEGDKIINERVDQLFSVKLTLDSIKQHDLMRTNLKDTTLLPEYQLTISKLKNNLNKTDSILNQERLIAASYQSRTSNTIININDLEERIIVQKKELERSLFQKENNFIWEPRDFPATERLILVFRDSLRFNLNITKNYISNHLGITFFLGFIIFLLFYWISNNLKKIISKREFADLILKRLVYLPKYPFLSSTLLVLAIAPFFYPNPPISFFALVLTLMVGISGILVRKRVGRKAMNIWYLLFCLFLISIASNLYYEVAYQERWHLLVFSLFGIYMGKRLINLQKEGEDNLPKYILPVAKIYIAFCSVSILANIIGRFSFAKMIGITGTLSLMQGIPLLIFVAIIKEVIYLMIEVSRKQESGITSVIDFYDIQKRINQLATVLAVAIWGYYFLESLGVLDTVINETGSFLSKERKILNASFTFAQIVIFILILYFATFLANSIAYLTSLRDQQNEPIRSKKLGSSILIIRLSILIVGFLIAAAASGIPLDKIAIILGAFSLGISFGLQTIVNNLVSGIILAFEKPIQIGDTVQVGPVEGVVKEIGIRASKIKNWDGAEVIIPNGDLLAQQLTNWTLSDKQRRVELIIGVSYNSDMDLVTELIKKQLERDEILTNPIPRVYLQTFADNSVNFRVLFWVNDVDIWIVIRDQVMRGIFNSFKENNIEIPFPQRDLHVKSFPGLIHEKLSRADD
ncbi:mechanosensitive ion channel family protein [Fontibacter flavus]|uniref:Mechanosensitive ion channel family protein n=1 Tax=Fontibacter flavus TaxID=654838 RepID=A0ABV6FVA9_9BACT